MQPKDFVRGFVIGGLVGILIQPILANNLPAHYLAYLTISTRLGIFLFFFFLAPLALRIAKWLSQWFSGFYQFAQFAAVGTLNSFIDVGIFNLETAVNGTALISNGLFAVFKGVSFLCATTNSFFWNKYWTFGSHEKADTKQVSSFYGIAVIGWVINVAAATFVKILGPVGSTAWVNIAAPLGGVAASFLWDFFGYKYLVFGKKGKGEKR
jgi:putative flippase GtrA